MTTLNRRELLQRAAYLMGGAVSAPAVLGFLNGCTARAEPNWKPVLLTPQQVEVVSEIAEIIIPRTDTPGAKDVGVPAFIDVMLKDVYKQADRDRFMSGMKDFESAAVKEHKRPFLQLRSEQQRDLVQRFHEEAVTLERERSPRTDVTRPFILTMKELTLLGFFTSEVGATKVLHHVAVPGRYDGCVPLASVANGRAWAIDASLPF